MMFGVSEISTTLLLVGIFECQFTEEDSWIAHVGEFINYRDRSSLNSNKETGPRIWHLGFLVLVEVKRGLVKFRNTW